MAQALEAPAERATAYLHDVLEDTALTAEDLQREGFPVEVIQAVRCLTRTEGEDYEDYIERVKDNPIAVRVKLSDLHHNMDRNRLPEVTERDRKRLERYRRAVETLTRDTES